jgi:hypothetical protein
MSLPVREMSRSRPASMNAFGQRPGDQHPVPFQPEVPVQPPRVVLLHDEDAAFARARTGRDRRDRLGRACWVALASILREPVHIPDVPARSRT